MDDKFASKEIEMLILYALQHDLIDKYDIIPARNSLLELLGINEPYQESGTLSYANFPTTNGKMQEGVPESPVPILDKLTDYAAEKGLIPDNTVTWRDLFDTKLMGALMPRQSEVIERFHNIAVEHGVEKATDFLYNLSINSNYIRMDRIAKNLYWQTATEYGDVEITINLSKPEKDPKDIAAARKLPQKNYPQCLLCIENVGYSGNLNHPARQNLRVLPITLAGEEWYFQYSPYVYYNEHCIAFHGQHIPMKVSEKTFMRLFDFLDLFPHYFIGSNADLPVVGGSILNHEHFQGGRHTFPMEKAKVETFFTHPAYSGIKAGLVKWPMSTLRLSGMDKNNLISLCSHILDEWRKYSDVSVGIISATKQNDGGKDIPHNTITPIARKNKREEYEIDLVFRNNRTSSEHPEGIFHPHRELHHIKKENIGLIEVMGLAVLPGRLKFEMDEIKDILTGKTAFDAGNYCEGQDLYKHLDWIAYMVDEFGTNLSEAYADECLKHEIGKKFLNVLLDAGVYKRNEQGMQAFKKLIFHLGFVPSN